MPSVEESHIMPSVEESHIMPSVCIVFPASTTAGFHTEGGEVQPLPQQGFKWRGGRYSLYHSRVSYGRGAGILGGLGGHSPDPSKESMLYICQFRCPQSNKNSCMKTCTVYIYTMLYPALSLYSLYNYSIAVCTALQLGEDLNC